MNKNPNYSIILYCNELFEKELEYIIGAIRDGIVVHLFLNGTFKEELDINEYIDKKIFEIAKKNYLLFIYEIDEELCKDNVVICSDGKIVNKELYNMICNNKEYDFNNKQYEIITADKDKNYIITSGAGTGKTTTMINRLIYLKKTDKSFSFNEVALITFTNKASREMRERLLEVLNKYYLVTKNSEYLNMMDDAIKCRISTIHGFSKSLINEFGKSININKNIKVKSFKYCRKKAIKSALNYLFVNYKELYNIIKNYPLYDVEAKLLTIWDKLDNYSIDINSNKYIVDFGIDDKKFANVVSIVIKKAQEYMDSNKEYEIEVSDLMKKLLFKELFYEAKGKYKYVMVDEFQDSDNIQIDFFTNFCNITGAKLLVVGDEKQSIYRFRGAEHTAFYRLKEQLKSYNMPVAEFSMVRNYRTNAKLLIEINDIFINIDKRVDKFNYKENDYIYSLLNKNVNCSIDYNTIANYGEEKGKFYLDLLDKKQEDEQIAVLCRSNNDLEEFRVFSERNGIPCRIDITGSFFRHEAVREFYIMIKALIDPSSNGLLYSFINSSYINRRVDKGYILNECSEDISRYLNKIINDYNWEMYVKEVNYSNILELIDKIIAEFKPVRNYYSRELLNGKRKGNKNYDKIAYAKALDYKVNLEHLLFLVRDNFSDIVTSIFNIEEFLRVKIATDNTVDVRKLDSTNEKSFLQCSTVHKAKGLEYDYVVLDKLTNSFISYKPVDVIIRMDDNKVKVGFKVVLVLCQYFGHKKSNFFMLYF